MESRAPAVVAVVVTTGPGPGLEATLASLVDQDYPELSLLVVANGETDQVSARVAAVAPQAFVKVLEENRGFGAACNEAALMVEGSAFFLFCHDDVRLDSDAVHLMVEAAYRANAGVVSPKVVAYEDPLTLLHVGQTCDRFGAVQERIEPGEVDHGQQDLERDVFVAPGGVTLVRADLFTTLRGFDPMITALGEDLDLSWRAQVAGARVIVAPAARVAHRETIATGERPVTALGTRRASRKDLQRRHQLLVAATGWGRRYSVVTLTALLFLDTMEFLVALVGRDTDRAGAIVGSWRWLLTHRRRIGERRRERRAIRVLSDGELHRLQAGGAHRLRRFTMLLVREGLDRARGILPEAEPEPVVDEGVDAGAGFGAAFAESEEFDEIPEVEPVSRRSARFLTSFRAQATAIITVAALWLIGGRNLVTMHLPLIGRMAPLDSWWTTWRHLFASWSPSGVGTGDPGMPGYGVLGVAGTFVAGRMGILPRVALLGAVPLGAIGVARLLKGRVSNRARVVASVAYLAMPVGLNMIAQGRLDVLAAVAGLPYIVRRLFELLKVPGFPAAPYREPVPFGRRGWRATETGQRSVAVTLIALVSAMVPATLVAVALVIAGVALARLLERDPAEGYGRPLSLLGFLAGGVAVLLAPLTLDVALAGRGALGVFGGARGPWSTPDFAQLARGVDGTFGAGWTGWTLVVAAACSFAICRGERQRVATKVATVGVLALALTAVVARHWTGAFTPDLDVLLALYAVGLVVLIGLGVSAVELDLRRVGFGWRQMLAGVVVAALVVSAAPFAANLSTGRYDLPTTSVAESLSALAPSATGGYRVLWLADPSVAPLAGWTVAPGLSAGVSQDGLPGGSSLFVAPGAGAAGELLDDVHLALQGRTVRLGQLLATAGISAIVVMNTSSPEVTDVQQVPVRPVPRNLLSALSRQVDLALELQTPSVEVYANSLFHGVVAQRSSSGAYTPVLGKPGVTGALAPGEDVVAGLAPADAFELTVNGRAAARAPAAGTWAGAYRVSATGTPTGEITLHHPPWNGLLALVTLLAWLYAATGFGGRRLRRPGRSGAASPGRHARSDDA
ncbi:MAG: glycosyltransferase family 2 protein [Acidobacteriota bacterium]|nr:glycosyltransferase family 2 protein [Acidobacteriota bacterium]